MVSWNSVRILLVLLLIGGVGCSSEQVKPEDKMAKLASSIAGGFEKLPSRLFVDKGRLGRLLANLGYAEEYYSYYCDQSSDGTSLRLWNSDRTGAILVSKGQPARIISTPAGAFLDDNNDVAAWYGKNGENHEITFKNGKVLFAPRFCLDRSGKYFCYGGTYYDYAIKSRKEIPIQISSIAKPEKLLATSKIQKGLLEGIYVMEHTVYIMVRTWPEGEMRNDLVCEEYARNGHALVFKRKFQLRSPVRFAAVNFVPRDFDPESCSFLLSVSREMPVSLGLGLKTWYIYKVKTARFRKVGDFEGYAGFLDRHLFDYTLENLSSDSSIKSCRPGGGN
jgi:hypothetical protein